MLTPNPKPETRNPKPETLNPKPQTLNPKPQTLTLNPDPKPCDRYYNQIENDKSNSLW